MNPIERRAALLLAGLARRGGWSEAAYADVLGAVGILSREEAERVVKKTGEDPDPNYDPVCPAGIHPARGNVTRDQHFRPRCAKCYSESRDRAKLRAG